MPSIDDFPIEAKRPFKKKAYRPWNLMDDEFNTAANNEQPKESIQSIEIVTNKESLSNHLEINEKSLSNQIVNKMPNRVTNTDTDSNRTSNLISNQIPNFTPQSKPAFHTDFNLYDLIQRVTGLQRKLLFYIVEDCILNGGLSTSPISTDLLTQSTNTDKDTIKTATQRLINKTLISRGHGKKGKGGYTIFCISEEIRNAVIDAKKRTSPNMGLVTNWVTNKEPLVTYSSNIKNNITTSLPEDWKKINFDCLEKIGFSETQLRQLHDSNTTMPEIVQDSINRFAYSLQYNDKTKAYSEPLSVLMGILRKGQRWVEPNYIHPKELALRQILEEKRKYKEQHELIIKELVELEFPEWRKKLTEIEINNIVPEDIRRTNLSAAIQATLRTFFTETVLLPRLESV